MVADFLAPKFGHVPRHHVVSALQRLAGPFYTGFILQLGHITPIENIESPGLLQMCYENCF